MVWLYANAFASEEQYRKPTLGGMIADEVEIDDDSYKDFLANSQKQIKRKEKMVKNQQEAIKLTHAQKLELLKAKINAKK